MGEVKRVTKETNVSVKINLDGSGIADSITGIPFLDHMLDVSTSPISNLFSVFSVSLKKLCCVQSTLNGLCCLAEK